MRYLALLALLSIPDDSLAPLREAAEKTGRSSYVYAVRGKYPRAGEFLPEAILTSRIHKYQSVRHGDRVLVKGPEGLWRTPEERLGERVENPADKEAPEIVRTLQEAEMPHRALLEILGLMRRSLDPDDREVRGIACRRYRLVFEKEALRETLERRLEKAIRSGTLDRPDEVSWSSARGGVWVYVSRKDGVLARITDERSVKLSYKGDEGAQIKVYKVEMEFDFSEWGLARPAIPPEVKERLGIRDP